MNLVDCHTHTQFSIDSDADIRKCIERAAELKLAAYTITDHCECNAWYPKEHYSAEELELLEGLDYKERFYASVEAVTKLKQEYEGRLNLLCGVELGQILHDTEAARTAASDERLDFIIGSVHQVMGEKDFYFIDYTQMTMDEIYNLLERYFKEVYELCKSNIPDVIGHITYCLRYMKQRHNICPDISRFDEIIADCFRTLAQNGKGIEINTSGLRQGFGDTFPDLKYVKLFRDMGGEIITLGSDAHTPEDIGKGIAEAIETVRLAGIDHICYFKQRKPVFIKI